mgnify:CR=1 FL=1
MNKKIKQVAKTAHATHRAYCIEMGIPTQPKWNDVESEHKQVVCNSVNLILIGHIDTVEESHDEFIKFKHSQGWRFGEIYSIENKINPRMVAFSRLTLEQRIKERLFFECVVSFR